MGKIIHARLLEGVESMNIRGRTLLSCEKSKSCTCSKKDNCCLGTNKDCANSHQCLNKDQGAGSFKLNSGGYKK